MRGKKRKEEEKIKNKRIDEYKNWNWEENSAFID